MAAISFRLEFLDAILRGDKCQTTCRQTTRFRESDTVNAYIQPRKAITTKPYRKLTPIGRQEMVRMSCIAKKNYPPVVCPFYPAHFIGRFRVRAVYDLCMFAQSPEELEEWAVQDGFKEFYHADTWFLKHHGADWMDATYTVIQWDGLFDRYFEPLE